MTMRAIATAPLGSAELTMISSKRSPGRYLNSRFRWNGFGVPSALRAALGLTSGAMLTQSPTRAASISSTFIAVCPRERLGAEPGGDTQPASSAVAKASAMK
jgi:hypothetical protein